MKTDLLHKDELIQHLSDEDFVALTRDQILKDLNGLLVNEPDFNIDYSKEILPQFHQFLVRAIDELSASTGRLSQFIYRVDLNEDQFYQIIYGSDPKELADLIIQREAKKVFFKVQFR